MHECAVEVRNAVAFGTPKYELGDGKCYVQHQDDPLGVGQVMAADGEHGEPEGQVDGYEVAKDDQRPNVPA